MNLFFYEAYMVRSHPQWAWLKKLDIGKHQSSHFVFSYPDQPKGNIRNRKVDGGGPLYDIGCYAILSGCMLFTGSPKVLSATAIMSDHYDIEKQVDATLQWPNGETLSFTVSGNAALCQALTVLGSSGWAKLMFLLTHLKLLMLIGQMEACRKELKLAFHHVISTNL